MATLKNPVLGLFYGRDWAVNKGALGTMEQPHPKLDPYYNGYYGGNFPSSFRLIGTEQMGINAHSAMVDNVYRFPIFETEKEKQDFMRERRNEAVPVEGFWKNLNKYFSIQ